MVTEGAHGCESPRPPRAAERGGWRLSIYAPFISERLLTPRFALAWILSLTSGLAFFLFVHFPGYLEDLGAGEAEIGLIVGTTALVAIAIRPVIGRMMDRRGRRPVILIGNALHLTALLLYLTVDAINPWLYVVRGLHGLGEAFAFASIFTYAADLVPESRRTEGLALFGVSGLLPIALGGVIGDIVLAGSSFEPLFVTAIGLGAAALVLSLFLPESASPAPEGTNISFTRPLMQRDLLPLWWVTLVFSFALTAYFTFLRTYIDETGIGSVGLFFSTYAATAIALRVAAGWLPDRVGVKKVLYPAMVLFSSGFILLAFARIDAVVAVAGVLCGAGHGYGFPILYAMAFGRAHATERGSASAIFTGLFDVGAVTGAPLLGLVVTWFGYTTMFVVAGVWVLFGLFAFAAWDGDLRRRQTTRVSLD
jgi:MFS family permease